MIDLNKLAQYTVKATIIFLLFTGLYACNAFKEDVEAFAPLPSESWLRTQSQLEYLSERIQEDGEQADYYFKRAKLNESLGKYRAAFLDIEACLRISGETGKYLYWKAKILAGLNDYEKALNIASKAVDSGFKSAEMNILLGQLQYQNGNTTEALPHLEKAYTLFPSNATTAYYLGAIYDDREDTLSAIRELSKTIQLKPDYTDAYLRLIQLYNRHNRTEAARPLVTKALNSCPPNASVYLQMGDVMWRQAALDSAVYWYREALQLWPSSWLANYKMAQYHIEKNNYELAESFYKEALSYNPNISGGYFQIGYIYEYYLNNLKEAKKAYEKGLRIDIDNADDLKLGIRRVDRKLYLTTIRSDRMNNPTVPTTSNLQHNGAKQDTAAVKTP